jgi:hypothetical protein
MRVNKSRPDTEHAKSNAPTTTAALSAISSFMATPITARAQLNADIRPQVLNNRPPSIRRNWGTQHAWEGGRNRNALWTASGEYDGFGLDVRGDSPALIAWCEAARKGPPSDAWCRPKRLVCSTVAAMTQLLRCCRRSGFSRRRAQRGWTTPALRQDDMTSCRGYLQLLPD